jgi:hypothetical protein
MACFALFSSVAGASDVLEGVTCVAPAPNPPSAGNLLLATQQYRWSFYKPELRMRSQAFVARVLSPSTLPRRYDYEVPAFRTERRVLWKYPELSCRYPVGVLPNDCETVWRNVYADMPVLATERDHIVIDVPAWTWTDTTFYIEIPQWKWIEAPLTFSVPLVVAPESCARFVGEAAGGVPAGDSDRAGVVPVSTGASIDAKRARLGAELVAVQAALDQGIANVDTTIASIKAAGGDPANVMSGDGKSVDMFAVRASLVEQRENTRVRFARMIADLDAQAAALPASSGSR